MNDFVTRATWLATTVTLALPVLPAAHAGPIPDAVSRVRSVVEDPPPGTWSSIATLPGPDARYLPHTAYAPELDLFIVFGGLTERGPANDVFWTDVDAPGATWQTISGGPEPGPRSHAAVAWDSDRHRLLVFGGVKGVIEAGENLVFGARFLNDLWALNFDVTGATPPRWEQLSAGAAEGVRGPGKRAAASGIYDPVGDRLIVFGGNDTVKGYAGSVGDLVEGFTQLKTIRQGLGDVWAFDLAGAGGWTKLSGGLPTDDPSLFHHQAIFDPATGDMVVAGGVDGNDTYSGDLRFNRDAYSFDLTSNRWTRWNPTGDAPGMSHGAYGYSAQLGALVVGYGLTAWESQFDPNGIYALELGPDGAGSSWSRLTTTGRPHPVTGFSGTAGGTIVGTDTLAVFGGLHSFGSDGDLSEATLSALHLTSGRWRTVQGHLDSMSATAEASAVYDPGRRHVYVVGGRRRTNRVFDLDLATGAWTRLRSSGARPEFAKKAAATFDTRRGRVLVTSGTAVHAGIPNGTLRWDVVDAVGEAPRLNDARAIYDPVRDRLLLVTGSFQAPDYEFYFGGSQERDFSDQVFALHLASPKPAWRELDATGTAPRLSGAAAAYDPAGDRVLVFGGRYPTGVDSADVYELSLQGDTETWRKVTTAGTGPAARADATAVYDSANDRLVVWGGSGTDPGAYALDLGPSAPTWTKLSTTGDPIARIGAAGVYDAVGRRLVVHGGYGNRGQEMTSGSRDTSALSLGGEPKTFGAYAPETYTPPEAGPVAGGEWSILGPARAHAASVALSPAFATDRTVYVGSLNPRKTDDEAAGLWVSRDAGASWHVAEGDIQGVPVLRIAPAPSDTTRVYAAGRGRTAGAGVYVSRDAGATWTAASRGLRTGSYFALAVHPNDPDIAWAASDEGGLGMTLDGGLSWDGPTETFESEWIYGLAAVPRASGVRLLAATRDLGSSVHGSGRVYASDDLGRSWDLVLSDDDYVTYMFAVDPSDPERVLLSAGNGIWRSLDGGTTWNHLDDRAIQAAWLAFDPTSDGRVVYGAGVEHAINFSGFAGGEISPAATPGIFRSDDGGISWTGYLDVPTEDFGGIAVGPDGREVFAAGLGSGVYTSADRGGSFTPASSGLAQSVTASIAVDAEDPEHMVAAGHYDGAYVTDDGGRSWDAVRPAGEFDPFWYIAASPHVSGRYVGGNYADLYKSENGGRSWIRVELDPDESGDAPATYFKQAGGIAFDPQDARTWYVLGKDGRALYITHDNGATFEVHDPPGGCPIPIAINPTDSAEIAIGDACGGGVFFSHDGGAGWHGPGKGLVDGNITALAYNPADDREIFAGTLHEGVFRSTDRGDTWTPVRAGIGYRYVKSIAAVVRTGRLQLFAAVRGRGVFESDDHGASWTRVATGMPSRSPLHLSAAPGGGIFAATDGAGVLRLDP